MQACENVRSDATEDENWQLNLVLAAALMLALLAAERHMLHLPSCLQEGHFSRGRSR
jgi:hypothetical protein